MRASPRTTWRVCAQQFDETIRAEMTKQFGYKNVMQVPMITKIVLNMGIGEARCRPQEGGFGCRAICRQIAGQKVVITKSRKSIAHFKIREDLAIGCKVTLRKTRMYEFLDRLITIALPRVRDFRGLIRRASTAVATTPWASRNTSFSRKSTYDKIDRSGAWTSSFARRRSTDEEAKALLTHSTSRSGSEARFGHLKRGNKEQDKWQRRARSRRITGASGCRRPSVHARARLKAIAHDKNLPMEERFAATLKLAELPRNSSPTRIRNRCELTGRPRAFYRKHETHPYRAARTRFQGPDPRHGQVELVGGQTMVNDPIGDMLTRIRNAQMRAKSKVSMPASKLRERVARSAQAEGYIRGFASVEHANGRSEIEIELKYFDGDAGHPRNRARVEARPPRLRVG